MTLKPLRIVAVGRLKTPFWKAAAEHYVERLVRWRAFTESIIKDGDPSLPIVDRNALEGKGILSALSASDIPVVLDERGKTFTFRLFWSGFPRTPAVAPVSSSAGPLGLMIP